MREILFKAKRKDDGEWVKGYYVYCRKRHYILPVVNKAIGFDEREDEWVEINSETLCQYTGLADKNGNKIKIWENDILRNEKSDIGVVQWFEEHAAFMIWNKTKHYVCYLAENDFSKIEIAGNEFDNPDLVEVE